MQRSNVIEISRCREKRDRKKRRRDRLNAGRRGRVYSRGGKLWVDFTYIGQRICEPSGLEDNRSNREGLRRQLDLILAEIDNGIFEFAKRFPHSKKKEHFTELEGKRSAKNPEEILFGEYLDRWRKEMEPGMSFSQKRDYTTILETHIIPYFSEMSFKEICYKVQMKKFIVSLKAKKTRYGGTLSAKRIQNVMIPLRVIVRDAINEYDWTDLTDPFSGLKMPKIRKMRIQPFSIEEWKILMNFMLSWYVPCFEIAVQTGMRPSEQVV